MPTKHNVHYLRPIYSPETLTFCYLMPFFRVFLPGCRKGHTRHTAGRWARDARDARDTGKSAGNARMSGVSCAGRAKQAGRAGRIWLSCSLFCLTFSDCPFCEHVLRKKNALSRLQGRSTPPRATRKQGVKFNICYHLNQFSLLFCQLSRCFMLGKFVFFISD